MTAPPFFPIGNGGVFFYKKVYIYPCFLKSLLYICDMKNNKKTMEQIRKLMQEIAKLEAKKREIEKEINKLLKKEGF